MIMHGLAMVFGWVCVSGVHIHVQAQFFPFKYSLSVHPYHTRIVIISLKLHASILSREYLRVSCVLPQWDCHLKIKIKRHGLLVADSINSSDARVS